MSICLSTFGEFIDPEYDILVHRALWERFRREPLPAELVGVAVGHREPALPGPLEQPDSGPVTPAAQIREVLRAATPQRWIPEGATAALASAVPPNFSGLLARMPQDNQNFYEKLKAMFEAQPPRLRPEHVFPLSESPRLEPKDQHKEKLS